MASGRPGKWVSASVSEPIWLGKAGIEIVIWDKYRKKRLGTALVSVGGIRWKPYKAKNWHRISWDRLGEMADPT
jgi:hypothetical protein